MLKEPSVIAAGFARLNAEADELLARFCSGRAVADLGAGHGCLSRRMLEHGAASVVAVEPRPIDPYPGLRHENNRFEFMDIDSLPPTALMSWPICRSDCGTVDAVGEYLAQRAEEVLYIGLNDRFTGCGWAELWENFVWREVLDFVEVPDSNSLILYGPAGSERRTGSELLREEVMAVRACQRAARSDLSRFR